ncbi:hypothetical protein J6590_099173 [Homalodisca vitripennis]|nr:hypothetical protein J6590_099173 [Homalodisca vitripennis]
MLSESLQDLPYVQQVFFCCLGLQQEERSRHEYQGRILETLALRRNTEFAFRRQPLRKSQPGSFRCPTTLHPLQYSQALSYSAPHYNQ